MRRLGEFASRKREHLVNELGVLALADALALHGADHRAVYDAVLAEDPDKVAAPVARAPEVQGGGHLTSPIR